MNFLTEMVVTNVVSHAQRKVSKHEVESNVLNQVLHCIQCTRMGVLIVLQQPKYRFLYLQENELDKFIK